MFHNDLLGLALYISFFIVVGLPTVLFKARFNVPFEVIRKIYQLVITFSIIPLVLFFNTWYLAMLAALIFALIVYPLLNLVEKTGFYRQIAVEREGGEFKRSLIIVLV